MIVAFPPCTHLCVSGARWWSQKRDQQRDAIAGGREARVHRMPPGPLRWKMRSETFQGVADAMAAQWGG